MVIEQSELTGSAVGLFIAGARVRVEGGRIAEMTGTSLSDGSGVVVSSGGSVALNAVTVESNDNVGVLIDGAATSAALSDCTVKNNLGRGVWVQNVASDAGVSVSGGELSGNSLVGLGALGSTGVSVKNVSVLDTQLRPVSIDISHMAQVGDGIGVFGSHGVSLENVTLHDNARAQLMADHVDSTVTVAGGEMRGGQYRAVVQASASSSVPSALIDDAGMPLTVDDRNLALTQ